MIEVQEREGIVHLRVPAPVPAGDLSDRLAWDLVDACAALQEREDLPLGVVISSGGEAFCLQAPTGAADCDAAGRAWAEATAAVARLGPPTLAAINADALGPAWEMALACDLRVASAGARVGSPEVRWGRIPSAGGTQRLVRVAGLATARRLLLLAEVLPAQAALELGLVHRVAPREELDGCLEELLGCLRASAPIALAYVKEAAQRAYDTPLEHGLRLEADLAALLQTTQDRAEGLGAFLGRRAPRFEGR